VSAEFLGVLAEDSGWARYHASASGPGTPPGGLLLLSRFSFTKVAYRKLPSASGRYALFATLDLGSESLTVANVHLESLPGDQATRQSQLDFLDLRVPRVGLTVYMGDFNFGDREPEARRLLGWTDAWTQLRPGEAGNTYDLESNTLAQENAFATEPSRRLDRILTSPGLRPIAIGLLGQGTRQPDPPSDHFGVWADLGLPP
jgi:endonuclease/exonuclease/phosphatase family metal-dependent hydrolase